MTEKSKANGSKEPDKPVNKGGRPRGIPNKASMDVKENILCVFNRLKGTAGMAEWAMKNQTEFYKFYAKLLPKEINQTIEVKQPRTKEEIIAAAQSLGMPLDTLFDEPDSSRRTH